VKIKTLWLIENPNPKFCIVMHFFIDLVDLTQTRHSISMHLHRASVCGDPVLCTVSVT